MPEHAHAPRTRIEPEISSAARQLVDQFSDDIKAAITAVAQETPEVARTAAGIETTRRAAQWYTLTIIIGVLVSASVAWLMINYYPRPHINQLIMRHGGTSTEACTRADAATESPDWPVFICVPAAPGQ